MGKRVNLFSIVERVWRNTEKQQDISFWRARLPRGYRAREGTSREA